MTDAEIAHRIKQGDREAARMVVERHYGSVLRFLSTLCSNGDDAAELTQDTFIHALNRMGKFRNESSLKTWLHRIAYHEFTHLRRKRKSVSLTNEIPATAFEASSTLAMDLERALSELPEQTRSAFVLCEIQELSVRDAATILGVPEGTIKSRVHTARQLLRSALTLEQKEFTHVA